MKNLVRICVSAVIVFGAVCIARAQEGPTRADFECLMLANSSASATPGTASPVVSYHHVFIPEINYGSFQSNGLDLVYETEGTGKEIVIVAPGGLGLPHEYLHPMLSNLAHYVKLVFFDRRSDMLSTRSNREWASIDEMADDIDALRQKLGLSRVTLLAHSFGGAVALNYALRYPDNLKRLILVNTSASIENPAESERRLVKTFTAKEAASYYTNEGVKAVGSPCERVRLRYRALYPHYFHHKVEAALVDRGYYAIYFDALAKRHVLAGDSGAGTDVSDRLERIKAPVLVFGGRYDQVTTLDQSAALAQGLPHSRFVVMEHSGHFPVFEENYMFTQWVRRFITGTTGSEEDMKTSAPLVATPMRAGGR